MRDIRGRKQKELERKERKESQRTRLMQSREEMP